MKYYNLEKGFKIMEEARACAARDVWKHIWNFRARPLRLPPTTKTDILLPQ